MEDVDKTQYKDFSFILYISIFILVLFAIKFNDNFLKFLSGNIIPELIGICIELLVIILVFNIWQDKKEHKKNIIHEKRLREYLIFFLKYGLKGLPNDYKIGKFHGQDYIQNEKEITNIVTYLSSNEIEKELLKSMKKHLCIDKTAIESLLVVASLLTDKHFKSWIRIVYFINKLSKIDDNNTTELKQIIIDILQNIKKFNKASYENNIYVGAKKP